MPFSALRNLPLGVASLAPCAVFAAAGIALWLMVNGGAMGRGGAAGPLGFVGWLLLMLVGASVLAIIWTASLRGGPDASLVPSLRRAGLRAGLLGLTVIVLALAVGIGDGFFGAGELIRISALFISWLALWCAVAWWLCCLIPRRAGLSVVVPLAAAMLLMAAPIVLMPLVHEAAWSGAAGGGSAWQQPIVRFIGAGCPLLAVVDAVRPAIHVEWSVLPGMYAFSGLGQEVPMTLSPWWVNACTYGVGAAAFGAAGLLIRARRRRMLKGLGTPSARQEF